MRFTNPRTLLDIDKLLSWVLFVIGVTADNLRADLFVVDEIYIYQC